jgi:hypothetical protein
VSGDFRAGRPWPPGRSSARARSAARRAQRRGWPALAAAATLFVVRGRPHRLAAVHAAHTVVRLAAAPIDLA